jgi:DNA-binding NarL/FixJ family response regulator
MKVFIVEDSEIVRENLKRMLSGISGIGLAGYAVDEAGAIEGIDRLLPDVVILDLHLQAGSGLYVLENIKKYHAATKVIVLSNNATKHYVSHCKQSGADYFFDKSYQFKLVGEVLEQFISSEGLVGEFLPLQQ